MAKNLNHTTLPTPLSKVGHGIGGKLFLTPKGTSPTEKKCERIRKWHWDPSLVPQKHKQANTTEFNSTRDTRASGLNTSLDVLGDPNSQRRDTFRTGSLLPSLFPASSPLH